MMAGHLVGEIVLSAVDGLPVLLHLLLLFVYPVHVLLSGVDLLQLLLHLLQLTLQSLSLRLL
jgi:hypothetical protein